MLSTFGCQNIRFEKRMHKINDSIKIEVPNIA